MFVRTASEGDVEAVRALLVRTWHDTYDPIYGIDKVTEITDEWHSLASLRARLERPHSEFLVADDGKAIAGMAFAGMADDGKTVALQQLYVLPERQGEGIGGMLLDEIESCFPDADKVRLEVEEANARALRFYQAQGFAKLGATEKDGLQAGAAIAVLERPILWAE